MGWTRGATIGRGASATVSLAVFTDGTDRVLAAKSAPVSSSRSLIREESALADLRECPQIVACFGHDVTAEFEPVSPIHNLLLEYLPRGSLRDALDRYSGGSFPEPRARRYARSIVEGLRFVHAKGYVHCDVKLHNVLLGEDGDVKIADFGLSRNVKDANEPKCWIRGTPMYMSPESVARGEYEPPTDIWAVGCAVAEMVSGRSPWHDSGDDGVWALMMRIGFGDEEVEIPKGVSEEAKDFLRRCLVRDPKERWTAEMLLDHPFLVVSDTDMDTEWLPSPKSTLHFPVSVSLESLEVSTSCAADRIGQLATGRRPDWSCRPSYNGGWISVREADGGAPVDRIGLLATGRSPDWWGCLSDDDDDCWTCVREV